MLMVLITLTISHAPQFVKTPHAHLQHTSDVSQAVYFKQSGSLSGGPLSTNVQVSFSRNRPVGALYVECDGNETVVDLVSAVGTSEPFTQTVYYTKFTQRLTCASSFALRGTFDEPWAVIVGTKEQFSAWELLAFPVISAKLHGSWWSENYTYHWWFVGAVVCLGLWGWRAFTAALFFASAANRLTHAWTPVVFADILPGLLVLSHHECSREWGWRVMIAFAVLSVLAFGWHHAMNWVVAAALIAGCWMPAFGNPLACFFVFGSGYLVAPLALLLTRR